MCFYLCLWVLSVSEDEETEKTSFQFVSHSQMFARMFIQYLNFVTCDCDSWKFSLCLAAKNILKNLDDLWYEPFVLWAVLGSNRLLFPVSSGVTNY